MWFYTFKTGKSTFITTHPIGGGRGGWIDNKTVWLDWNIGPGKGEIWKVSIPGGTPTQWIASSLLGRPDKDCGDVSPDGKRMAFTAQTGSWSPSYDIYAVDIDGKSNPTTIHTDTGSKYYDYCPTWSLDGNLVVWPRSQKAGVPPVGNDPTNIVSYNLATKKMNTIASNVSQSALVQISFIDNGKYILMGSRDATQWDIQKVEVSTGKITKLTKTPSIDEYYPSVVPIPLEICGNGKDDDGKLNLSDGKMVADPKCGTVKWEATLPEECGYGVALDSQENIIVTSGPKEAATKSAVSFDRDGKQNWSYPAAGATTCPVIDDQDNIYLKLSNKVLSIDSSGKKRWEQTAGGGFHMALDNAKLHGIEGSNIITRSTASGAVTGTLSPAMTGNLSTISINHNNEFMVLSGTSTNGYVSRFSTTGIKQWTFQISGEPAGILSLDEAGSWLSSPTKFGSWTMYYRTINNAKKWDFPWATTDTNLTGPPIIAKDKIYLGARSYAGGGAYKSGCAFVINRSTGKEVWKDCSRNASLGSVLGANDVLYVPHFGETLTAYDLHKGTVKWDKKFSSVARSTNACGIALGTTGTLYITHISGWGSGCAKKLYAFWTSSIGGLNKYSPWPKHGHDNQNSRKLK